MTDLNEKLARWRWPDAEIMIDSVNKTIYVTAKKVRKTVLVGWFTLSTDSCFKWLVPELDKRDYYYELSQVDNGQHKAVITSPSKDPDGWADVIACKTADAPARALAEAIWEAVKDGN